MSKVIIGIHGLGNKPQKDLLEEWWKTSIIEGFTLLDLEVPNFKFELVYWADLIYELPEDIEITDKNSPYFLEEPYLPSCCSPEEKDTSFRKKVLHFIAKQMEKVLLNKDFTLNYKSITDAILYKYFREMEMYYGSTDIHIALKQKIRKRLKRILKKYKFDDILLIGHSMGSIIAYDVLQFELKRQKIHTFVSMGSPLGLPFIRSHIANEMRNKHQKFKISTPETIEKAWLNFADLEDKVALNFDMNDDYEPNSKNIQAIDFEINNDYEINGEKNPHKSFGYLRSREFIIQLNTFLTDKKDFSVQEIARKFQKVIHQIKYKQ